MAKRKYLVEELGESSLSVSNVVFSRVSVVGGVDVEREVDSFVRLYDSAVNIERIGSLSGGAVKLLLFAMGKLGYGENYVAINVSQYMRVMGVGSKSSYRSYVRELMEANIFARTNIVDVYYFDHNLFYKGSRVNNLDAACVINLRNDVGVER